MLPPDGRPLASPATPASGRPFSIQELAARSRPTGYDSSKSLKDLVRIAAAECRAGDQANANDDIDSAFIHYAKASTLLLEDLRGHPKFDELTSRHKDAIVQHGRAIVNSLDAIKGLVSQRFLDWCTKHPNTCPSIPPTRLPHSTLTPVLSLAASQDQGPYTQSGDARPHEAVRQSAAEREPHGYNDQQAETEQRRRDLLEHLDQVVAEHSTRLTSTSSQARESITGWVNAISSPTATISPATISSTMSISKIIRILVQHGCPDVTQRLDSRNCGRVPVANGGFGDIYKGSLHGGMHVAIKCTRFHLQQNDANGHKVLKHTAAEIYAWSRLNHSNVMPLLGLGLYRNQIAMLSPWMDNGTLLQYLSHNRTSKRFELLIGISEGVAYLHGEGIIHGDIKSSNVLISQEGVPKLIDFGCTELKRSTLLFTTTTRSPSLSIRWAAPEALGGHTLRSKEADVYALGMTLLEVITGKPPFHDLNSDMAVITRVYILKQTPQRPEVFTSFEKEAEYSLWLIISKCWLYEPAYQPDSGAVRNRLKALKDLRGRQCPAEHSMSTGLQEYEETADLALSATRGIIPEKMPHWQPYETPHNLLALLSTVLPNAG